MNESRITSLRPMGLFLGILLFFLTFLVLSRTPADPDMWWHLRIGQEMWAQKTIILTDQFSYTRPGTQWTNAFWLSEAAFYLLYRTGGLFAISLMVALVGGITFTLLYQHLAGNHFLNSAVLLLSVFTAAPIWGPRPQVFSFLLLALLDRWLEERRPSWALIPLFTLWANLHGGWIWGFLLLIAHIAGIVVDSVLEGSREQRAALRMEGLRLFGWSFVAAFAIGVNPNGLAIWKLPFQQISTSMQIQEWLSPDFHRVSFHPLLWMLFLLVLTAPFAGKIPRWSRLFKVIGFAYLTFVAQRNIALFAIVSAPLLSDWANATLQTLCRKRSPSTHRSLNPHLRAALNALILIAVCAAALARPYSLSQPSRVTRGYPAAAIEWMQDNQPEGRLFNSYNWGGYILWSLPEYPVFIDGRADLYGNEIIGQWLAIANATDEGISLLDSWDIQTVLLEPYWPLTRTLVTRGWVVVYRDEIAVILRE